jgi:hypothetical protein
MIRVLLALAAVVLPSAVALAERPPLQMQSPPPAVQGQPPTPVPQVVVPGGRAQVQTQIPPSVALPGQSPRQGPSAMSGNPADQPTPIDPNRPQWPNQWLPGGNARIQALDKVNAQTTTLNVKIGQPATFGSLTINVKACVVRPPDQPADAAAYLDVTDSHADSPGFNGWMLANEPSVSMMQNPIYDLRVAGCG